MNGDDPQGDDLPDTLALIARTLGVPVAAFLTTPTGSAGTPGLESFAEGMDDPAQVVALLRLFARLKNPEARARCLAYVVQEATHDD